MTADGRKSDARRSASVMYYSHDTYGLGHLRRTITLARFLPTVHRLVSQLIVTGSPLAHRFQLPPRTDYIKLPSVLKIGFDRYEARHLQVPFSWVRNARKDILLSAARHVRPELLVVDNVPCGLKGELLPTLRYLSEHGCRLVLGLRDVVTRPTGSAGRGTATAASRRSTSSTTASSSTAGATSTTSPTSTASRPTPNPRPATSATCAATRRRARRMSSRPSTASPAIGWCW